jgi:HAD superfamily hydrolase (TIGR01509 family)
MIRAVLFDLDGLLIDTEKWFAVAWPAAARRCGFAMTREHALFVRSLAAEYARPYLKRELGADFDYDRVRTYRREMMEDILRMHGIECKPGAKELLAYLKKKGVKRALATATDEERARRYLSQAGLLADFDEIVCATMVAHGKPAPDVYAYACARIGENPSDCLALEDSPNGVKSAAGAGCRVVMVPDLTQPDEEIRPLLWRKADSLLDVVGLLEEEAALCEEKTGK